MDQSIIRGNKVDRDSTRDLDMKQRRTINAAPSVDPGDYVTRAELDALRVELVQTKTDILNFINRLVNGVSQTDQVIEEVSFASIAIQYKDWASVNQSQVVVTGITVTRRDDTYVRGLRKT